MISHDTDESIYERDVEVEALEMRLADVIQERLEELGVSRAELARLMGVSKAHVTQTLSGQRNLTLRTVASALHALDSRLDVGVTPRSDSSASEVENDRAVTHSAGREVRDVADLAFQRGRKLARADWFEPSAALDPVAVEPTAVLYA